MKFTARPKSLRAAGGTSGCTGTVGAAPAPGAPPGTDAVPPVAAPAGRAGVGAAGGGGEAGVARAGAGGGGAAGWGRVRGEPQAASSASAARATTSAASAGATGAGLHRDRLFQARDDILRQLRLAVTRRLQARQRLEALAHPLVVDPILGARGVQLVRLDRFLLERKHLLLEERIVFLERIALELRRPLRGHDVLRERAVELRHLVVRGGGHLGDLISGGALVAVHRSLERIALDDETLLQRRAQPHRPKRITRRLRERQLRLRGEIVGALGALRSRLAVDADNLLVPAIAPGGIAALGGVVRETLARFLGVADRRRVRADELLEHAHRAGAVAGLGVEVGGLHQRLALHGVSLGGVCGDALELRGGLGRPVGFRVGHRELAGDLRLQLVLRELAAEILEHADGAVPLLEGEKPRGGVVLGVDAGLRLGRHSRDAQEILHRAAGIARLLLRFALLVYAGGEPLGEIRAELVVLAGESARLQECRLRLVVLALIEVRLRNDRPGDALLGEIDRRLPRQDRLGHADGARPVARGEYLLGRAGEDTGAVGMLGEGLRELDPRVGGALVPRLLLRAGEPLLSLLVGRERRVGGGRRLVVARIAVGGALVLGRGSPELVALEQRLRQQVVGRGGVRILRERLQVVAVPARRLLKVRDALGLLGARVKEGGDVLQVRLELLHLARVVGAAAGLPVRRVEVVALDELVLAVEDQLTEAALGVRLDRRHREVRRLIGVGIARDISAVDARGVLVALLVDVQVAEPRIEHPAVGALADLLHILLERGGAVVVGKSDAHHPERVLDQLAIGALERLERLRFAARAGAELLIEHAAEGRQALRRERLLEQRPAALIETLLVEQ